EQEIVKRKQMEEQIKASLREKEVLLTERERAAEELRGERDKAQKYLDIAGVMFVAINTEEEVALVNQKGCDILGYEQEEIIGKNWFDNFLPAGIREEVRTVFQRLMAGEIEPVEYYENPVLTKDNEKRIILWHNTILKDEAGNIISTLGSGEDITERKQSEERQKLATKVLELLNESGEDIDIIRGILLLIKDFTGFEAVGLRLTEYEDFPYYEANGFPPEFVEAERYLCARDQAGEIIRDSVGNPILECMCGNVICGITNPSLPFFTEGGTFWTNSTTELLASTTEEDRQSRTRNRCHGEGYESVALIPLRSDSEIIGLLQLNDSRKGMFTLGMINFFEEIGDSIGIALVRNRTEEQLRYQANLLENVSDAIISTDMDFVIQSWNEAAEKMYGWKAPEVIGKPLGELVKSEYPNDTWEIIIQKFIESGYWQGESIHHRKDGTPITILGSVSMLKDNNGNPVGAVSVNRDITDRKQAEKEREVLIKELEAKNTELEQFTYTVSHDLKSPLFTIKGFLGLLEKDSAAGDTEQMKTDITYISDAVGKMQQLLDELLELSRIGRLMNPPEEVPLDGLVRKAMNMVAGRLAEKDVKVEIAPNLPVVYGDSTRLREVLENLVDNAVKFMGDQPAPCVEIGVRRDGKETVFYVRDNGVGIEPRYHEKVFGLFDKLDKQTEGTGAGLAIVKRIVEVHGGRIWVESEGTGKGSAFCFTLPDKGQAIDERRK
ncbi:PAS domain S-box protein, partial [bacterium]|nr:PAS domain S-box protein [bacterium]